MPGGINYIIVRQLSKYINKKCSKLTVELNCLEGAILEVSENMSQQATFKALSDNTRRQILRYLREGDMSAGEIAEKFNMSKPSISHHLNILKQADLVSDQRQGQSIIYSLNTSVFEELVGVLMELVGKKPNTDGE